MSEQKPLIEKKEEEKPTYSEDPEKGETSNSEECHRLNFIDRLRKAREQSDGPLDFLKHFFLIILDTVGFLIFAGILLAIPIAMIVVGALELDNCQVQKYIPIWLLTSGAVMAGQQLVYIIKTSIGLGCIKDYTSERVSKLYALFNILLLLFTLGWFIAGNVWVFSVYPPNFDDSSNDKYCDIGLYYFSFAAIIATYAWILFTVCCSGCVAVAGIKDVAYLASNKATGGHGQPSE